MDATHPASVSRQPVPKPSAQSCAASSRGSTSLEVRASWSTHASSAAPTALSRSRRRSSASARASLRR
eukprot:1223731-Alexandrium_andersonii.AAC.1